MSTSTMPPVPPRPARSQQEQPNVSLGNELPKIPPRPINRRIERSVSPSRESFARSPLNEMPPHFANEAGKGHSSLYAHGSATTSSTELPPRPSSVVLPSVGQEGSEYAEIFAAQVELGTSPTTARTIANDLKLHAPKPSLPVSSAKQRVSAVTRTDSGTAASYGIGKAVSDDADPASRSLKKKASVASAHSVASNGTERPPSSLESEHGIPEIGQRVPMLQSAGDVQAPSPASFATPFVPGIGFHNDGSKPRHHGRKASGRGVEIPFDAYGKHGHGQIPTDRLESAYYEKHPELYKKETGHYHGPFAEGRAEWAMSSEDLNKIVRDTASRGVGNGKSPAIIGTPSEQVGFQASEEYASRISSPRPQSSSHHIAHSNASTHVDSPLRRSIPSVDKEEFEGTLARGLQAPSETALESEVEEEDTIHVDVSGRRSSKIYGSAGHMESTDSLGPHSEDDGLRDEHGYSAPILAADEVAKEPFGYELEPAVSPLQERRHNGYEETGYHYRSGSASSLNGSRPSSRPGSIHGTIPGFQVSNSTPLEDLAEYEPLFPEEATTTKKPLTVADKVKRPELKNRKFPSQDVWEDSPDSLHYTATVSTPQLPEDEVEETRRKSQARENETPAEAFARRQEELAENEAHDSESFLNREKKPWAHKAHVVSESRPTSKQRFPSRDIWEDTPDSLQLETTVAGPQSDGETVSPPPERPTTGAVAQEQERAATGAPISSDEGRATTGILASSKPHVPARPARAKPTEVSPVDKSQPTIPERPRSKLSESSSAPAPKAKPTVPARPSKPLTRESSENVPLSKVTSNGSNKSVSDSAAAIAAKPKPAVPSRPVGSKIAALQGGFMSDLNKRLQLGPHAPKKEEIVEEAEVEKEKAPLVDARKGRARGPARRAPAKSPAPAAVEAAAEQTKSSITCSLYTSSTVWQIDPDEGDLYVPTEETVVEPKDKEVAAKTTSEPEVKVADVPEPKDIPLPEPKDSSSSDLGPKAAIIPASAEEEEEEGEGEDLTASVSTVKADDAAL